MRVLVTGANGFVGSHIVETLLEVKHSVMCAVRKASNLRWLENLSVEYKYGDLDDKKFSEAIVKDVDGVIHCAGIVRAMSMDEYFKANAENTKNLCEAVLKVSPGLKKFIFISSQAAMGPSVAGGVKKVTDKNNPVSDYGLSKLVAESEVKKNLCGKVPYTILRPAVIYGPRDKDIFIFFNLVHKHFRLTTMTKRFLQLIYVKDVANAVTSCLENKKTDNNTYYLANSTVYTWSEIGKIISSSADVKTIPLPVADFVFKFAAIAAGSLSYITKKPTVLNRQKIVEMLQQYWTADTEPAENDLNIEFTSLEVASEITYNWYLSNKFF
ncbi:MAG: NAD(P)-dependent oxidoreductase [Candidatus Endomicrobiellum trichonymphae]|uniref:NAD-dependent epimerase/dehydratase family protein n=1 Tax=Endomicrobium trichonymphae TaxID=1408204 RepID=UPI0027D41346|nr:MAG: NAD(P)-dependent oxidoreductase [Candidatus Endomicrobium trichonymphae]